MSSIKTFEELEELRKQRKQQTTTGSGTSAPGSGMKTFEELEAMRKSRNAPKVGQDIQNRVNAWIKNNSLYMGVHNLRYNGRKGTYEDAYVADSAEYLDAVTSQKKAFDTEYDSIMGLLDQYGGYYDSAWVDSVRSALDGSREQQEKILKAAQGDKDYWGQFTPTQEATEQGYTAEQVYGEWAKDQGYRKKYEGVSYDNLKLMHNALDDEDEKRWLDSYMPEVMTSDDYRGERTALEKELYSLRLAKEQYDFWSRQWSATDPEPQARMRAIAVQYGSPKEIQAEIENLSGRLTDLNNQEKYSNISARSDFEQYAAQGAAIENPTINEAMGAAELFGHRIGGKEVGNIVTFSRDHWEELAASYDNRYLYHYMKEDEVKAYNYLLAKEGKESAQGFLDYIDDFLRRRAGSYQAKNIQEIDSGVLRTLATGAYGLGAGVDQWVSGTRQRLKDERQPTSPIQYGSAELGASLEGLGKNAYDATVSVGNMLPMILASSLTGMTGAPVWLANGVGAASMGVSVSGNAYARALDEGYSKQQARAYGDLVGASEGVLQYLIGGITSLGGMSTEKLLGKVAAIDNALLRIAAEYGVKIGDEIIEEELQNYLEPAFRMIIFGEEYDAPTIQELLETAITTAMSTGVLEAPGTVGNVAVNIQTQRRYTEDGRDIMAAEGGVEALKQLAYEMHGVAAPAQQKQITKLSEKVTGDTAGGNGLIGKAVAKVKNASNARKVGKLLHTTIDAVNAQSETQLAQSMVSHGMKQATAQKLSGIIVKSINGTELTESQVDILESLAKDERVVAAMKDTFENPESTAYKLGQKVADFSEVVAKENTAQTEDGVQYSLRGKNEKGIEVYEISQEVRDLPYKERAKKFQSIMRNEYRGRTAKFQKDGQTYYARFEDADIRKNIYGDKKSDYKGRNAKISAGAEGDIFELVENADYYGSSSEHGKTSDAHKGVSEWDYFVKTVQIDDAVYYLIANVRKNDTGEYVYSIQLNENKKIEATPLLGSQNASLKSSGHSLYKDSISESGGNVNGKDSAKSEMAARKTIAAAVADPQVTDKLMGLYRNGDANAEEISVAFEMGYGNFSPDKMRSAVGGKVTEAARKAYQAGKQYRAQEDTKRKSGKAPGGKVSMYYLTKDGKLEAFRDGKAGKLTMTGKQSVAVKTADFLHRIGIGGNVYFFESYEQKNAKGETVRVFKDKDGNSKTAPNGIYYSNGDIYIDINAGMDASGITLTTLAHELVHYIQQWSGEKYRALAEFLAEQYEKKGRQSYAAVKAAQKRLTDLRGENVTFAEAYHEWMAESMSTLFNDGKLYDKLLRLKKRDSALYNYLKKIIDRIARLARKHYGALLAETPEAQFVQGLSVEAIEALQQKFADALVEAGENHQNAEVQKDTAEVGGGQMQDRNKSVFSDAEIQAVQNIGRVSIHSFSSAAIKATEKLARRYWGEMGKKSPFFRAWFGDWRENDQTPIQVASIRDDTRGAVENKDTGWDINISGQVFNETKSHNALANREARPYLPYINDIVRNAVLLDTYGFGVGDEKSHNSLLMHSMYAVADVGNGPEVLKLYVEEMNNPSSENTTKRAYQLQNIEKAFNASVRVQRKTPSSLTNTSNAIGTVADLFAAVKRMDRNFNPNPPSKVVNADGMPRVMYHGTNARFTAFDKHKARNGVFGKGFYFAPSKSRAGAYGSAEVLETYLNIRNPYIVHDSMGFTAEDYRNMQKAFNIQDKITDQNVVKILKNQKYDGIIAYDGKGNIKEIVAFEPDQIKSATDNIGTFDGNNPDIRYQDRMKQTASGREAFAQVLDSVATDDADRLTIQRYRDAAKAMDEQERKLNEINAQIREITYGTGEQDSTKLRELRLEASKARNRAKLYEDQLTKLEHSQPYQKMMGAIQKNGAVNAVGAAAAGFDTLSSMEYEYGNLPEGENAVRDDTLPKSTNDKDKVSLTARTVKGAKVTPDEFVDLLDKDVVEGGMSYMPISNNATTKKAIDYICRLGWEDALAQWRLSVGKGNVSAETTAVGALLLNNAAKAGDKNTWLDILHDYQKMGTNMGQALQAMRILKKLDPDDSLYMIRRSVAQMVADMGTGADVRIDKALEEKYLNAKTDAERDAALDEIAKDVADQIPRTKMEMWTAIRYLNMLGNLRTQVRNVTGNIGMMLTKKFKDTIAAGLETIASAATGGKFQRTKSVTADPAQLKAAREDFSYVEALVLGGGKYSDATAESSEFARKVQDARKILPKGLEHYRRATNWAMDTGDAVFSKAAYARALAGWLKANGIKETDFSKIDAQTLDQARAYAVKEAQEATFRDYNTLSRWVAKAGRGEGTPKFVKGVVEGIMPFRKTPANILVRAVEYSPIGFVNSAIKSMKAMQKGTDVTGAEVINSWAKTLTGTGLFALGMLLQNVGMLVGGPDDDEEKDRFEGMYGWQNYALVLGDTTITIDFLSPAAIPMFMGAQLQKLAQEDGIELKDFEAALSSVADPLIEMSMLQGVNDTLENIQYAENSMGQLLINAAMSYLTQGLTNTMLGQIERTFEDTRMTTYVDKDSAVPAWLQRQIGKASAKIPGWDYQQIPYINAWGEEEENPELAANAAENMLSPSYISKGIQDKVFRELNRLNDVQAANVYPSSPAATITYTGTDGVARKNYALSADDWVALAKKQGQTARKLVEDMVGSRVYADLPDVEKGKAISKAYEYARELARQEVLPGYPDDFGAQWMAELEGDIAAGILAHITEDSIKSRFQSGDITAGEAAQMRVKYSGDTPEEAAEKVAYWDFQEDNPGYADLNQSAVIHWYDEAQPAGIALDVYHDFMTKKAQSKGVDKNGDGKADSGTIKKEVLALINSIEGLTYKQRKVLKEIAGYK